MSSYLRQTCVLVTSLFLDFAFKCKRVIRLPHLTHAILVLPLADLLKRHAERHDKREQSGLHSQPKPGRIKGSISTKKRQQPSSSSSRQSPPNPVATSGNNSSITDVNGNIGIRQPPQIPGLDSYDFPLSNSAPGSVGSFNTPLPSPPIIDNYDHDRKVVSSKSSSAKLAFEKLIVRLT